MDNALALRHESEPKQFRQLSQYAPTGVVEDDVRVEVIATISAGYRGPDGLPKRSTDGKMYFHGDADRAGTLLKALNESGQKQLTITFPSDDESEIIQQFMGRWTAGALEAYGDEEKVVILASGPGKQRVTYTRARDPEKYMREFRNLRPSWRILFYLMAWSDDGLPELDLSDGMSCYAITTGSKRSLNAVRSAIRETKKVGRGRVAGVPFRLWLDPAVPAIKPDGKKINVPVFKVRVILPNGLRLTPRIWREVAQHGLEQSQMLRLAAPITEDDVIDAVVEPTEDEIHYLENGGHCDVEAFRRRYFAAVKGTYLAEDAGRAAWLRAFTQGRFESLSAFLQQATDEDANKLIMGALDVARNVPEPVSGLSQGKAYDEMFTEDDLPGFAGPPAPPASHAELASAYRARPQQPYGAAYSVNRETGEVTPWKPQPIESLFPPGVIEGEAVPIGPTGWPERVQADATPVDTRAIPQWDLVAEEAGLYEQPEVPVDQAVEWVNEDRARHSDDRGVSLAPIPNADKEPPIALDRLQSMLIEESKEADHSEQATFSARKRVVNVIMDACDRSTDVASKVMTYLLSVKDSEQISGAMARVILHAAQQDWWQEAVEQAIEAMMEAEANDDAYDEVETEIHQGVDGDE